jgi:hypothetical protein
MPIFATLDALDLYMVKVVNKQIASEVQKIGVDVMNDVIAETIYANPSHMRLSGYQNTYGMMNKAQSNTKEYGNGVINTGQLVEVEIKPDGDYPNMYGDVRNNNDMIIEWLTYRKKGGFYNSRPIKPQNYQMFDKAMGKLLKGSMLKKKVTEYLKSRGYVISKTSNKGDDSE